MNSKLTLTLDKDVLDNAKNYARKTNQSLSKLVEKYFTSLGVKKTQTRKYLPPVSELSGIIHLDEDFDFKKEYADYLSEKYS